MGLRVAARLGFRGVTLSAAQHGTRPRELDRSERRGLIAELKRLELTCDSIDLFIPPEHFVSQETMDRAIHAVRDALDLASDLGSNVLFLRLPHESLDDPPSVVTQALVEFANSSRVRVADVGLGGRALNALESGAPISIGIGIDTASWLADGRDPLEGLILHGGLVGGVRLAGLDETGSRVSPSPHARIDIQAWRQAFEINAHGASVVIDARGWQDPVEGVAQALHLWRS
jgi:sugar phosphate isomerase/epimerase